MKMKIIELRIENMRCIAALVLKNLKQRGLIKIHGMNKQGKSTVIDSLFMLMMGGQLPVNVVQKNAKAGKVEMITSAGYTLTRTFKNNQSVLRVKCPDGSIQSNPGEFAKSLISTMAFDPRPFFDMDMGKKINYIKKAFKINTESFDISITELEQERLLAGRELDKLGELAPVENVQYIDPTKIKKFNDEQNILLNTVTAQTHELDTLEVQYSSVTDKITALKKELEEQYVELSCIEDDIKSVQGIIEKCPQPKPKKDMLFIIKNNTAHTAYNNYVILKSKKNELQESRDILTQAIVDCRKDRGSYIRHFDFGIKGLCIEEDGLYYNDIHCDNWSGAEAALIAAAVVKGMDSKLKCLFIDNGEKYDEETLNAFEEWAVVNDIQGIITLVSHGRDVSEGDYYITEGEIHSK